MSTAVWYLAGVPSRRDLDRLVFLEAAIQERWNRKPSVVFWVSHVEDASLLPVWLRKFAS